MRAPRQALRGTAGHYRVHSLGESTVNRISATNGVGNDPPRGRPAGRRRLSNRGYGGLNPHHESRIHRFSSDICIMHSVEFARVTPSLPQRGGSPRGHAPLTPKFWIISFKKILYPVLLHGAGPNRCLHRSCDADLRRRSLLVANARGRIENSVLKF